MIQDGKPDRCLTDDHRTNEPLSRQHMKQNVVNGDLKSSNFLFFFKTILQTYRTVINLKMLLNLKSVKMTFIANYSDK
jgi:hypothetical protein